MYQRFHPDAEGTVISLLEALYKHTTTTLAENPDDIFRLIPGVRQGEPESPPLYNLYMYYVMRASMHTCQAECFEFTTLKYKIFARATTRDVRRTQYQ